jgi:phosphatidylserine/phosphatidylglycerophosphate/cardiolipin synthase-like enzyme
MFVKVLYTTREVRSAITELFKDGKGRRRVVVSAYIGDGAEYYLPFADGVQVICSPTPGATNPHAIRKLIKRKAEVWFCDKLHMKVYWSEGKGAVITSANLSTNALGVGGLKEAGVLLGPNSVDIEKLLATLARRPAKSGLHELDLKHREYHKRNSFRQKSHRVSFAEWYRSPIRQQWKLMVCIEFSYDPISQASQDRSLNQFGTGPCTWAWSAENNVVENEWVLCAALRQADSGDFGWLYVDHIQKVSVRDKAYSKEYPYELVQLQPLKTYEEPPFEVNAKFKKAFRDAAAELNIRTESKSPTLPHPELLAQLYSRLSQ